ncbi:hypothetical protein IV203_020491 [Nitzschia inconspicua]|uniref:Uncharacterized protein n=1 Tax=Nitzschia inconspicua TaxID=303405 RepID=A0A9K3K5N4_9STRA|nr:hypothetical protein IV203_020491 [Nitzschia inconspicua]
MILRPSLLLLLLASESSYTVDALHWVDVPGAIITNTRRFLNLSGISGYAHSSKESPYDRVMGHPVFQVTTPWGSAYMNMEKLDLDDIMKSDEVDLDDVASERQPWQADIRVTTVSLAKALRSAANLGNGLLTGQPIDYKTERVGLFGTSGSSQDSARELAVTAVLGNSALSLRNLQRRQAKRDRKIKTAPKTTWEAQYGHMDGQLGIPVFYARGMERQHPLWKGLVSGHRRETPLFFNYEDLERAWKKTRSKDKPEEPTVEVFNLWDVLTSMDKEQDRQRIQSARLPITKRALQAVTKPLQRRLSALPTSNNKNPLDLDSITFVPSSDACLYKESITARGNGKARLRPMR